MEFVPFLPYLKKVSRKDQHSQSHVLQLNSPPNSDLSELDYARFQEAEGTKICYSLALKGRDIHTSFHFSTNSYPISTAYSIFSLSVYQLQMFFFILFYVLVNQNSPDVVIQVAQDCSMQVLVFSVCNEKFWKAW